MQINEMNREYAQRADDEKYPTVQALIAAAAADRAISREKAYNWKDLSFNATGDDPRAHTGAVVLQSPKGHANLTHWSFSQAARALELPPHILRDKLTPHLAADCLNYRITQTPAGTDAHLLLRAPADPTVPVTVRACTSETYGRVWDQELYDAANKQVFQWLSNRGGQGHQWQNAPTWEDKSGWAGARSDRDSFLWQIDGGSIVTDPSARNARSGSGQGNGDSGAMYRGILIRNSEVGACSVTIDCVLFRWICGNWMIGGLTQDKIFRRRHFGKHVLRDVIRELLDLSRRWTERSAAQDEQIIRTLIDKEIAQTEAGVIDELKKLGYTIEQAKAAYATCERTEQASPRSYWGLVQGTTRASQESAYLDARVELDRLAAALLAKGAKVAA